MKVSIQTPGPGKSKLCVDSLWLINRFPINGTEKPSVDALGWLRAGQGLRAHSYSVPTTHSTFGSAVPLLEDCHRFEQKVREHYRSIRQVLCECLFVSAICSPRPSKVEISGKSSRLPDSGMAGEWSVILLVVRGA